MRLSFLGLLATFFLFMSCFPSLSQAAEQQVDMHGNNVAQEEEEAAGNNNHALLASKLKANWPDLDDQDAVDIATILHKARQDPETTWLLYKMRQGDGKEQFADFAKNIATEQEEIVKALRASMKEIQSADILFRDGPERAFKEMLGDGLIPPDKIELYRKDTALLESDLRKNLYFMFISYAAAGGYL